MNIKNPNSVIVAKNFSYNFILISITVMTVSLIYASNAHRNNYICKNLSKINF